ncbi:protein MCM10 homolog [Tribolium madens]|uniref:protein MCM10 homolog n=1 Tax=Tribolium madens TaxID=41895 RepID=UPI001CF75096|nr:protein MCM10 homolog [Tribolium madens]
MSEDLLDSLLSVATEELKKDNVPTRTLTEADLFGKDDDENSSKNTSKSLIHTGDTDSSDDEDNKYYEERKYNDCGREIKHLLESSNRSASNSPVSQPEVTWKSKSNNQPIKPKILPKIQDVQSDPIFGLRVVNPVISFNALQERMVGREAVAFARIKKFVSGNISDKNWVIAGVIAGKSAVKTSQKGNEFIIWCLSDLKNDIKTVSVLLFGSAYKQLWKTVVGTVVGILNPSVLESKDNSRDEATLSVDNSQKVLIMGQSRDLGTCKSMKKNGGQCTNIVNTSHCEYCVYHIKQEYQKCSKRAELQSSFVGKGLTALRNKVLGKNEVFYAGKSYTAIPAKRSKKLEQKEKTLLQALSGNTQLTRKSSVAKKTSKVASHIEVTQRQRLRDFSLLERLGGNDVKTDFKATHSPEVTLESSKKTAVEVISKLKAGIATKKEEPVSKPHTITKANASTDFVKLDTPVLLSCEKETIDLGASFTPQQINRAKLNALKYVQKNGPLKKSDPNSIKSPGNKKRPLGNTDNLDNISKRPKIVENEFLSDRFKKMMETTSKHMDVLDDRDNEEQEKYFEKLEKKEQMENKMINTFKVACKAVRCLQCKYTHFSASQFCKDNKHPLKVFDAMKRFFKCGNCGNRITSLEIVPTLACKNCGSGMWEKTGMMKEKTVDVVPTLSIRGGEQEFVNSVISDPNLNLLVCRKFNEVGSRMLSRGFIQLEKRHAAIYKRVKSLLPRRESERRVHPLSRHCDILQAVETRISMLNMTYMKYIENNLLCFIPGKVLDEMINVLSFVESDCTPPRTHQLLQELRDLSSMAMEHFDEHILPRVKEHKEQMEEKRQAFIASFSGSPSTLKPAQPFIVQQVNDLQKIKKQYKTYKHHIAYLNQNTQKLIQKMKKQNKRLKAQSVRIRDQERKIQEQTAKIQEQETALADIKKHMDEWDQKYKDLTNELVRARDYILLKATSSKASSSYTPSPPKLCRSSIRPRVSHLLFRNYGPIHLDLERKRKSNLLPEIPVKVSRAQGDEDEKSIDELLPLKEPDKSNESEGKGNFSFLIENLIKTPLTAIKSRKRKMAEEIDLK